MSRLPALTLVAAIPFLSTVVSAAEPGWYVGAAYADVSSDINEFADGMDAHTVRDDRGFKLIGGYQAFEWLAFEADYADLGNAVGNADIACIPEEQCGGEFDMEARAWSIAALASFAVGPVDLFARVGLSSWETKVTFPWTPPGMSAEMNGTDPAYGIGIRANFRAMAFRLEFERQDLGANRMRLMTLGATYTFGL
jgi:hypothetical protein